MGVESCTQEERGAYRVLNRKRNRKGRGVSLESKMVRKRYVVRNKRHQETKSRRE